MEFDIAKCAKLIMKSGKSNYAKGIELPNQERIRTFEKEKKITYFGIFEADTIKREEMK